MAWHFSKPGPIEPVADIGENLLLVGRGAYYLYKVAYIEPLSLSCPLIVNLGAIASGAVVNNFNTQNILDMQDGSLAQLRAFVLDDIHVQVAQPQAVIRGVTRNITARWTAFSKIYDDCDHLSEFFIASMDRPYLTATNPTGANLAQARIAFYGYKYVLEGGPAGTGPISIGWVPEIMRFTHVADAVDYGRKNPQWKWKAVPVAGWQSEPG